MKLSAWAADLLDLLLPEGCVVCRNWIPQGDSTRLVCVRCRTLLKDPPWPRCPRCHLNRGTGRAESEDCMECRSWPPALHAARYAFVLAPPAADLVHALKYEGWPELADFMGDRVARLRLPAPVGRRIVTPVPTTRARLRLRGYNQAELLARRVSDNLGLPMGLALTRVDSASSQTSLAPHERWGNVRGAFTLSCDGTAGLRGADVLLVDDVLTTGATAAEAASVLRNGGAARVTLVAFARALPMKTPSARD